MRQTQGLVVDIYPHNPFIETQKIKGLENILPTYPINIVLKKMIYYTIYRMRIIISIRKL